MQIQMNNIIDQQFKLISALADTTSDRMWSSDILQRVRQIRESLMIIESEASKRIASER